MIEQVVLGMYKSILKKLTMVAAAAAAAAVGMDS